MNEGWRVHISTVFADINAALVARNDRALSHLKDAQENLEKAIARLEEELE